MTANITKILQEEKNQAREMRKQEGKLEPAKALLDILEDEVIAKRLELPLEEIQKLRR